MANTTWNPSDKSANITLTGSNLIATAVGTGNFVVRAVDRQISGRWYWECTCTTAAGSTTAVGLAMAGTSLTSGIINSGPVGTCGLSKLGNVYVDGTVVSGISLVISSGTVVCVAADLTARLIWWRLGAGGNWNASASANPATGAGGVSIPGLGVGIPAYPAAELGINADQITANFGDTAFTGAVPSGFTSGFTAGASISTNALTTQVAVEHWLAAAADAQVTQVAVEHWASIEATYPVPSTPAMVLSGSRAGIGSAVLVQDNATRTQMLAGIGAVSQFVTATPTPPATGTAVRAIIMA